MGMTDGTASECPSSGTLQAWLDQSLGKDAADKVWTHVESCVACTERLDRFSDDDALRAWKRRTEQANAPVGSVTDQEMVDRIERVKQVSGSLAPSSLSVPLDDSKPTRMGQYEIDRLLGRGAFGMVFSAWDPVLKRTVAIKQLNATGLDARVVERFMREAQSLAGIHSRHVVRVFDVVQPEGQTPYLVMEFIDGGTLLEWSESHAASLQSSEILDAAVRYVRDAARGLVDTHEAGVVHRDVKPSNILLDSQSGTALLADFGLAQAGRNVTLTADNELLGTPAFMSPEQARGEEVDHRTDIYSLGVTLYQLITRQQLFRGTPHAVLQQIVDRRPTSPRTLNPSVSRDLETVCLKALEKMPSHRYRSCEAFLEDLERLLRNEPVSVKAVSNLEMAWRWCQRNRTIAATLVLLFASMALGTIATTWMWLRSEANAQRAKATAIDLVQNRRELRTTVSRFQGKLFSEQSLHWQMAPEFRAEMFREFIDYLDKFSALEDANPVSGGEQDSLAADYLEIAEAAAVVSSFEEASLAATRALERIREVNRSDPSASNLHLQCRAATVANQALQELGQGEVERGDLAAESLSSIQAALTLESGDFALTLSLARARLQAMKQSVWSRDIESEVVALYGQLEEYASSAEPRAIALRPIALPIAVEAGWFAAKHSEYAQAVDFYDRNAALTRSLREYRRARGQAMFRADYMTGENLTKLALHLDTGGERELAMTVGKQAYTGYKRALESNPQNTTWRRKYAQLEMVMSDWHVEAKDYETAATLLNDAISRLVTTLRNGHPDDSLRLLIVFGLIKKAQTSLLLNDTEKAAREFYSAAQDCRYFVAAKEHPSRQSIYALRLWLLRRVFESLPESGGEIDVAALRENELNYATVIESESADLDAGSMRAVINGDLEPDAPDWDLFDSTVIFR